MAEEELEEAIQDQQTLGQLLSDMTAAEDRAEDLREEANDRQAEADDAKAQADALKDAADDAEQKLEELQQLPDQIGDIRDQLADPSLTEGERNKLQQQLDDLENRQDQLETEKDQLEQDIRNYESAYDAYEEAQKAADEADRIADNAETQMDHLDQTNDMAASEQIEADEYQRDADEAKAQAQAKQEYADSLEPGAEEAAQQIPETEKELSDVQSQIDDLRQQLADPDLTQEEYDKLMEELDDLKEEKKELQEVLADQKQTVEDHDKAQKEADEALQKAEDYQSQADAEQENAEEVKQEKTPIYAGDDLTITARDDVGKDDPLDITAGGETNLESQEGDANVSGSAHMNLGSISGENVQLNTSGDIKPTGSDSGINTGVKDDPATPEDESKTETEAEINALGSSAGTSDDPLKVDADRLSGTSGDDVNIQTPGSVIIDQLTSGGNLKLDAGGDILAGDRKDDGATNITGGSLDLSADGDIGTKDAPLVGDIQPETKDPGNDKGLLADADDIYLKLLGDVTIRDVNGDDVHIDSDGRIDGAADNGTDPDIEADNLLVNGNNGVGTQENPLIVVVPGITEILSKYGEVWFRNLYSYIVEMHCCCKCSFWDMVIERIEAAGEGETVDILETVPCHRMPRKVMDALRDRSDVTLILHLEDGTELIIGAGEAMDHDPLVECYSILWLVEFYMGTKV